MDKFIKSIRGWLAKGVTNSSPLGDATSSDPFALWADRRQVPVVDALNSYDGLVYACVRAICEEIANMKYVVKRMQKDGSDEIVDQHDVTDALESFNSGTTGYEAKYKTSAHLELCGNAFWYLEGVKSEMDQPAAMHILNPGNIKKIMKKGVFPHQVDFYEYRDKNQKFIFQPYEILHFKYPDPNDDDLGIGTVQSIATWIDSDKYANEVNRKYFINGARVGGYLSSEKILTPAQSDYLKRSFEAIHRGAEAAYKTAVLPQGVKYTPADTNVKDMDFANLSQVMSTRILAGFRVPKSVLGISEDVNRANAEAGNYIFALRTVKPKMQQIVAQLNEFFVPRFGQDIWLDFEDPVPENTQIKIQQMQAATGNKPVLTQNEAREMYFGLDSVDGGDTIQVSQPGGAFGADLIDPQEPKETEDEKKSNKAIVPEKKSLGQKTTKKSTKVMTRAFKQAQKRSELAKAFAEAATKAIKEQADKLKEVQAKKYKDLQEADWEVLWKAFVDRNSKYESKMKGAFEKVFESQKEKVIKNLATAVANAKGWVTNKAIDPNSLLNKKGEMQATIDLVTPIFEELYQKEGVAAGKIVGQNVDLLSSEQYKKALAKVIQLLADNYTDTTMTQVAGIVDQGLQNGDPLPDIADKISQTFDDWSDWRASSVAQTETFRVANMATKDAWKETGVVKSIKWYTANDEKVCEFCGPEDGTVIPIDDDFYSKGESLTGSDGGKLDITYSDVGAPPLHVNCRCYSRPEEIDIGDE